MLSSSSHQQQQKDALFPVQPPSSSSSIPVSFVRRSTKFSRECSVSSIISTTTKAQNHPSTESVASGSWAPNQQQHCHGTSSAFRNVSCPSCPRGPPTSPLLRGVSLLHASDKVTILPAAKAPSLAAGHVRNIPIKQLVTPAMPLPPSSAVGTVSASASSPGSSSATSPSVRPLRVAQPPPLATAFPSCSSAIPPPPPNPVDASSSCLPNSISVPSLPKPAIPFHRSAASVSSEIGSRAETTNGPQHPPGRANGRGDRGRSRFVQMGYEELLELARNQQRQIETNEDELDERRKAVALFGVAKRTAASQSEQQQNARILMANLRAQISRDELEMVHLGKRQKEAKKLKEHNEKQSRELAQLEGEYAHDEEQLRRAVAKVDSLRTQLEMLYQRRAVAADAAVLQHRQINGGGSAGKGAGRAEKRPKASVVPFQQENGGETAACSNGEDVHRGKESEGKKPSSLHPPTFQPTINWRRTSPQVDQFSIKRNSMTALKRLSWVAENGADEYLMNFVVNEQKKGRTHISFGEMVPKPSTEMPKGSERNETNENGGTADTTDNAMEKQPHLIAFKGPARVGGGEDQQQVDTPILEGGRTEGLRGDQQRTEHRQTDVREERKTKRSDANDEKTDQQQNEQRTPTAKEGGITDQKGHFDAEGEGSAMEQSKDVAAKGTSSPMKRVTVPENAWEFHKKFAEKLSNNNEEEKAKRGEETVAVEEEEREERGRGKTSQNTPNLGEELDESRGQQQDKREDDGGWEEDDAEEEEEQAWGEDGRNKWEVEDDESMQSEGGQPADEHEGTKKRGGRTEEGAVMPREAETSEQAVPDFEEETDGSPPPDEMTTDESSSSAGEETPVVFEESALALSLNVRSILRRPDTVREQKRRRVMFDLIVLFLDVAYEGQYDTLVELASKIEDISISNSEGTTALHYAICAGNSDIVKFLIENGADVNALDVDGWSPLHCAASCNNPKMLRQLIENGACPFATTFGMSETATQLFDETLDFAVAANYMETVEHCMGVLNDGRVYAAYPYEAAHGDELSFSEGDELRVLRKSEDGEEAGDEDGTGSGSTHFCWWLCEHSASACQGLVPRNYLGLYPMWKFRSRYSTDFELPRPSCAIDEQQTDDGPTAEECPEKREERDAILDAKGDDDIKGGQHELSTYA